MKLSFVSGNRHKFQEVKPVLKKYGITIVHVKADKPEMQDSLENVAAFAAKVMSQKLRRPVVLEDTGVFFHAYHDFPGAYAKHMFDSLGFDGFFRLLRGKSKRASFKTAAAYCVPNDAPKVFIGETRGRIVLKVRGRKDVMPYDRIFVPDGHSKVYAEMMDSKHLTSHRVKAFEKLARYLRSKRTR